MTRPSIPLSVLMACCLLLVGGGAGAADVVDASTLKGKVLLGYQGWSGPPWKVPAGR